MSLISELSHSLARIVTFVMCGLLCNGANASSRLHQYAMAECSKTFCVTVKGETAYLSNLSPTLASENVVLKLAMKSGSNSQFQCSSMAYLIDSSMMTCELAGKDKTLVVDLANSEFHYY